MAKKRGKAGKAGKPVKPVKAGKPGKPVKAGMTDKPVKASGTAHHARVPKYLMYFGLVLIVLTLANVFASDVYPSHKKCEQIIEPLYSQMMEGEGLVGGENGQTTTTTAKDATAMLIQRCNNVQNDLFISYVLVSVGIAFLIGGMITVREAR